MTRHLRLVTLAVLAALAVALPSILAALQVKAPYLLGASVAIAAILACFATYWRDSLIEVMKKEESDQMALRGGCLMIGNQLPTVRHVTDPTFIGVHPARRLSSSSNSDGRAGTTEQPLYVPRDIDLDLRELLATPGFVLIAGDSTAGKTRSAFEAVAAALPDHTLIAVQDKKALASAISQRTFRGGVTVLS
jgi:hypothetical protein